MRTVRLIVTVPSITESMTDEEIRDRVRDRISLITEDALYDAEITVELAGKPIPPFGAVLPVELANPERRGNGTMIYDDTYEVSEE